MITEKVREVISQVMQVPKSMLHENTTLMEDLGVNSMELFEIIIRLEEEYDIELPQNAADSILTVGDLARAVSDIMG